MDFQFLEDFKKLTVKCPPESYKPKNIPAFRWVFEKMTHLSNFTPRYHLVPQTEWDKINQIKEDKRRDSQKCGMLALSMFDTENGARDKFSSLLEDMGQKIYSRFGTHIAYCDITEKDGYNGEAEEGNFGHFNHHPVKNHNYETRFKIISKL